MRLTGMSRLARGVKADDQPDLSADLEEILEHLKWNLWHGKVNRALEIPEELDVTNNQAFISHYVERYRQGKTISTAFVESAVNQVVSKRYVKKQQLRWTERGAQLLLQIRTQVLNGDWRTTVFAVVPRYEGETRKGSGVTLGFSWSRR
jgi:hypothetical protein